MSDRHTISPYPIRMPPELRALLESSANHGARSLHAEIIARLWSTFRKNDIARQNLGLPFAEEVDDHLAREQKTSGVDKSKLIESSLLGAGVTREELLDAVSSAIESALSGLGAFPPAPDNAKPKPNTGPKPRKRFPKED
ncbi:Arc family DNA-binding protein [Pseudomonas putida]|uniref:Arc family DNA-binding protein n=1 Tax=Pseudomonas putida TaxID=303 RepID=UPI003905E195